MRTFLLLFLLLGIGCCDAQCKRQQAADRLIQKIERYRKVNGNLPESITLLGETPSESARAFYEKTSDSTYTVYYGLGLGSSMVYDSITRTWREEG